MKKLLLEFKIVEKKDTITIFAYSEGKRVGYIQFSPSLVLEKQLVVRFIQVDEKWRGKRIAERLLKNVVILHASMDLLVFAGILKGMIY